jgi:hypothetical protein
VTKARLRPLVEKRARRTIAFVVFVLAFVVRALWTLHVQSPLGAVYSDMGGYVSRAEMLLAGITPSEPRILALWPWGTHAVVALEFAMFGRHGATGIAYVHALVGALVAPAAALLTARFVRSKAAVAIAGVVVALWHPHVVYSGFFSSELWFSTAITLGSLLFVRHCEGRRGAFGAGLLFAFAFVNRPQIVLTAAMIGAVLVLGWRHRAAWRPRGGVVLLVLPFVLAAMFSSVRLYRLTGRVGLINLYEQAQRLFGETNVEKLEAAWKAPNGDDWTWWASPHTKQPVHPEHTIRIDGFIADPVKLSAIRAERLRGVPWTARVARTLDNVALLVVRNNTWPENDFRRVRFRAELQYVYRQLLTPLLLLCAVGLFCLRRHRAAALVVLANLATIIITAAIYLGEARYRVPYDPLVIVVATVGGHAVITRASRMIRERFTPRSSRP